MCAGGADHGHFATIRVRKSEDRDGDGDNDPFATGPAYDTMSLDGEDESSSGSSSGRARLNVKELGGYIVNSVTLHRPPSSTSDDDVLAVLTYGKPCRSFTPKTQFCRGADTCSR